MSAFRLFIFDLAGTTVRDHGQVPNAFRAALELHGLTVTPEQLSQVRGLSKRAAVRHFLPRGPELSARAERIYASFQEQLAAGYRSQIPEPVADAEAVFRSLRARRVRVALNTGFDREITGLLLKALRWDRDTVDAVVCGDDVPGGRPEPHLIFRAMELTATTDVQEVATVGDTVADLQAGHRAGVRWNIGVLSGAHERARLESAPHTHIVPSLAELPEF